MDFGAVEIPAPARLAKRAEYDRKYERSGKGRQRRNTESAAKRQRSLERYLSREFIAWDGEGINETDGSHTYFLLANSVGDQLVKREGLSTSEILALYLDTAKRHPDAIHVVYGGSYDINMTLRDLTPETLRDLTRDEWVRHDGYRLQWRAGKCLTISKGKRTAVLYDVLPFFQRSFVQACDEYLGTDWEMRDEIIRQKAERQTFDYSQLDSIIDYNRAELRNLVRLCNELRERLWRVELRVNRWDGPGAVAVSLFQKYRVKDAIAPVPDAVAEAGRYAYAGGRFECLKYGHSEFPAYQYDINSAYPSAIRHLPCLAHGEWQYKLGFHGWYPFALYHLSYTNDDGREPQWHRPNPLFKRNPDGTVMYPGDVTGWYWTPEARIAVSDYGASVRGIWVFTPQCDHEPFGFVEGLYRKRAALKKTGDGAHVGIKLGLNSLYGKLAQQVGWQPGPPLKIPPYHCLEWAGFVTSHCRAEIMRAASLAPDDVIAFETDAIFSRVPLDLPLGSGLGEWEMTEYRNLTYLKSGMYWGTLADGKEIAKTRGIDKNSLTRAQVIDALENHHGDLPPYKLSAKQTRFIGARLALATDLEQWTHWVTSDRAITVDPSLKAKRHAIPDGQGYPHRDEFGWYPTMPSIYWIDDWQSHPYSVDWINPIPEYLRGDEEFMSQRRMEQGENWWMNYE